MAPLINHQHEKFCLAYFSGKNGKEAAIEAGYSEKTAYALASRLLRNVKISERLRELQEAAASARIMGKTERMERLSEIARARVTDFVSCSSRPFGYLNPLLLHGYALTIVTIVQ